MAQNDVLHVTNNIYIYTLKTSNNHKIIIQTSRTVIFICYGIKKITEWPKMTQNEKYLCHQQLLPSKTSNNYEVGTQM